MEQPRLKRSYIRRKPRRNRPPIDWPALQAKVLRRDQVMSAQKLHERLDPTTATRMAALGDLPCVAWIIEGGPITCHGNWQLDHLKPEPRLGVKGLDDSRWIVSLCAAHDERGMKGGYQWNTAHRPELRAYLETVEG